MQMSKWLFGIKNERDLIKDEQRELPKCLYFFCHSGGESNNKDANTEDHRPATTVNRRGILIEQPGNKDGDIDDDLPTSVLVKKSNKCKYNMK